MRVLSVSSIVLCFCLLQSCISVPLSRNKANTAVSSSTTFEASAFEPFKRNEYTLLDNTTGTSSTRQMYILFFPIGRLKNDKELEQNAYFDALNDNPNADAVILPRIKTSKIFIPLILVNFYSKKVTLTGRSIKLNAVSDTNSGRVGTSNK